MSLGKLTERQAAVLAAVERYGRGPSPGHRVVKLVDPAWSRKGDAQWEGSHEENVVRSPPFPPRLIGVLTRLEVKDFKSLRDLEAPPDERRDRVQRMTP